ncbi:MAG: 4'-phosphopantetheinyl transferase superfamily protein [Rhodocyclaceae bacterium]|nr:4'-phosphopantetheinyl transferase superfamily protein [Rhodocyclaceae bacterium]MCL4759215.1 4'-phosphopantetheinyl transferase superfamily protein [Rhodocyclaceae bacterium]
MPDSVLRSFVQAIEALFQTGHGAGDVRCFGLRFDGFDCSDWGHLRDALCAGGVRRSGFRGLPLSGGEIARARRFVHAADAVRHLAGRILLRRAARHAAGRNPSRSDGIADWPCDAFGKPRRTPSGWEVSIAHSGPEVWVALASGAAVGIDVEIDVPEWEAFGELLHPLERIALSAMRSEPRVFDAACRRVWTRKEAVVKAAGLGLSMPLDGFEVLVDATPAGWLCKAPQGYGEAWTVQDRPGGLVDGGEELAGAVAVAAAGQDVIWRLGRVSPSS